MRLNLRKRLFNSLICWENIFIESEYIRGVNMEQLFNKSQLLTRLLDRTKVGVLVTDPSQDDNPIVYANQGFTDMTGYEESEVIGTNCRFLQGEDTDREKVDQIREAIRNDESISVEIINYRKDGSFFWNELNIECVTLDQPEVKYFIGIQKDVSVQKEVELSYFDTVQRIDTISTPIVPLVNGIAVIPLVGEFGKERFDHMFNTVTKETSKLDLSTLIVDVSGLEDFDEYVVEGIFRLRDILQLVGTDTVLTGISPILAKQSISLKETKLKGMKTASSVKDFLRSHLERE